MTTTRSKAIILRFTSTMLNSTPFSLGSNGQATRRSGEDREELRLQFHLVISQRRGMIVKTRQRAMNVRADRKRWCCDSRYRDSDRAAWVAGVLVVQSRRSLPDGRSLERNIDD